MKAVLGIPKTRNMITIFAFGRKSITVFIGAMYLSGH